MIHDHKKNFTLTMAFTCYTILLSQEQQPWYQEPWAEQAQQDIIYNTIRKNCWHKISPEQNTQPQKRPIPTELNAAIPPWLYRSREILSNIDYPENSNTLINNQPNSSSYYDKATKSVMVQANYATISRNLLFLILTHQYCIAREYLLTPPENSEQFWTVYWAVHWDRCGRTDNNNLYQKYIAERLRLSPILADLNAAIQTGTIDAAITHFETLAKNECVESITNNQLPAALRAQNLKTLKEHCLTNHDCTQNYIVGKITLLELIANSLCWETQETNAPQEMLPKELALKNATKAAIHELNATLKQLQYTHFNTQTIECGIDKLRANCLDTICPEGELVQWINDIIIIANTTQDIAPTYKKQLESIAQHLRKELAIYRQQPN